MAVPEAARGAPGREHGLARGPGVLITRLRAVPSALSREASLQLDRPLPWTPVAFGIGAAAYLALKQEPSALLAGVMALVAVAVAIVAAWSAAPRALVVPCGLLAVVAVGFVAAKLHSDAMATPIAPAGLGVVTIDGWVVDVESPSDKGARLLIAPIGIERLTPAATPGRVRIVVPAPDGPEGVPPPGSAIRLTALLDPPPGPAAPGAYDFARDAWFEGIGGVGLALRPPRAVVASPPPIALRAEMAVNALRWAVAGRLARSVQAVMGADDGGAGGLAAAVTTSHQDWLAAEHRDALRGSGLAHMLAIAGLHMAAVSGFAFFALRICIAAWPWLALRVPGKKIAALGALMVVAAYLVLSGGHPPARRAAITASVAFLAILADRRAVSMHSLALAALVILALEPDAVAQPGFEMSFCATASLVALAEIRRRPAAPIALTGPLAWLQKARDGMVAMMVISLVAGAATGPFTIQHFNRIANYGVFANLTADFLASAVLMPILALNLLAVGLGLAPPLTSPLLWLAGWAAKGVIWLGHVFSAAPGAGLTMSSAPEIALVISYLGIVFACLWRGRLRWIGLPMAAAVALWPRGSPPLAWIAADGDDAAVVIAGEEVALKPGQRAYATGVWAQRRALRTPIDPVGAQADNFDCDRAACRPTGPTRPAIAAWWTKRTPAPARLAKLCEGADILILRADVTPPAACEGLLVLDKAAFARGGAVEVFAAPGGWRLVWSQPLRGARPWTVGRGGA